MQMVDWLMFAIATSSTTVIHELVNKIGMYKLVILRKTRMNPYGKLKSYIRRKRLRQHNLDGESSRRRSHRSRRSTFTCRSCILQVVVVSWLCLLLIIYMLMGTKDQLPDIDYDTRTRSSPPQLKQSAWSGIDLFTKKVDPEAGQMGKPYFLPRNMTMKEKRLVQQGWRRNGFNQYASDLISVKRSLPDPRDEWCKYSDMLPISQLPATSVIICFHNEAWSTLLRSVHSVLNRTPPKLLKEVILVDDFSKMRHLKAMLDLYMSAYRKVKIIRAPKRLGLIRARMFGASIAKGPVLTFLDSHVEASTGWLEPLLDRIARSRTTVACPVIDVIDDKTLEYTWFNSTYTQMGGFDWSLTFRWFLVPEREMNRRNNTAEPIMTPTMAGGLFSIDKKFFDKLGAYDPGFEIWGGENLELSFKTWMCGGKLEIVPCSHVGHIFREMSPYEWLDDIDVMKKNSVRLAKVWMDDYAKFYFMRIRNKLGDYGDVSSRIKLRESLKCKDFDWYVKNIFPELYIPKDVIADGLIITLFGAIVESHCIQAGSNLNDAEKPIELLSCKSNENDQYWTYTSLGEIRRDSMCIDFDSQNLMIFPCHEKMGNQFWVYDHDEGFMRHPATGKCMVAKEVDPEDPEGSPPTIFMEPCYQFSYAQRWRFERFNKTADMSTIEEYSKVIEIDTDMSTTTTISPTTVKAKAAPTIPRKPNTKHKLKDPNHLDEYEEYDIYNYY